MKNNFCLPENSRIIKFLPYFLLFLIVFAVYFKTINYGLTTFDDNTFVELNASNYSSKNVVFNIFTNNVQFGREFSSYYRPVLMLSFALDNKIAGPSASFAHFTNVALHCLSVLLLFFFAAKYIFGPLPAFCAAAVFAVHPLTIQTVAWIPGRNDSLLLIVFLLSFILFLEYLKNKKILFLILHLAALLAAFFTKESAIAIPALFVLYCFTNKDETKSYPPVFLYFLWAAAAAVFLFARSAVISSSAFSTVFSLLSFSRDSTASFFDYYSAALFFRAPMAKNSGFMIFISGIFAFAATFLFSFYGKLPPQRKKMFFYFILPVVFLLPVFITERPFFNGNRAYIALAAVIILGVHFCAALAKRLRVPKKYLFIFFAAVFIFSFIKTSLKSEYFKSAAACWEQTIKENPQSSATIYLMHINALISEGKFEEALQKARYVSEHIVPPVPKTEFTLIYALILNDFYNEAAAHAEFYLSQESWKENRYRVYLCLITSLKRLNEREKAGFYADELSKEMRFDRKETQEGIKYFENNLEITKKTKRP